MRYFFIYIIALFFFIKINPSFAQVSNELSIENWDSKNPPLRIYPLGKKYVNDPAKFPGPIEITASMEEVPMGDQGCVDFTVSNFNDITRMEFTITSSTLYLEYVEITNIGLPGMTQADFNGNPASGLITVEWENLAGATVPDGTLAFSACFTAIGNVSTVKRSVGFGTIPVVIYATDLANGTEDIGINTTDGGITIISNIPPLEEVAAADITGTNCNDEMGGAIDITVNGGVPPYTFAWSNMEMTEDINNLTAGNYTLTITDSNSPSTTLELSYLVPGDFEIPISDAGSAQTITCILQTVILDGSISSTGADFSYNWSSPDGGTIIGADNMITADVNSPGTYELLVTNNSNGCTSMSATTVSENTTLPLADAGEDFALDCISASFILDGSNSEAGMNIGYNWTTTDGTINANETTNMAEITDVGTYTLTVINSDNGCESTDEVVVTEALMPVADAPATLQLDCINPNLIIDASASSSGMDLTYEWTTTDGNIIADGNTLMPSVDAAGTYDLLITNTTNDCTDNLSVIIESANIPEAILGMDTLINCDNPVITLDGSMSSSGMNISYQWTTPTGNIISGASTASAEIDMPGTYELLVTNTSNDCTASETITVTGSTEEPIADAGMTMELGCSSTSVILDGSASSTGSSIIYEWTTADGDIIDGADTPNAEVSSAGTYMLLVSNTDNNCMAMSSVEVTAASNLPVADAGMEVQVSCSGVEATLDGSASSAGANYTYEWTTMNGNIISGSTTLTPSINAVGTYQLTVLDTDTDCESISTVMVSLDDSLVPANVLGEDFSTCEDSVFVMANLPDGATGLWSGFAAPNIQMPESPETPITLLIPGENNFVWTLSIEGCPSYSRDTINIFREGIPQVNEDQETIDMNSPVVQVNVIDNDNLNSVSDWDIVFTGLPSAEEGTFEDLGDGLFDFTVAQDFIGTIQIPYEICNFACPTLCDSTAAFIIVNDTRMPPSFDSLAVVNGITPNGDGINDEFIFDILDIGMDEYPNNEFIVFNRWGDVVYEAKPYNNDWSGQNKNGNDLPEGTYYYILRLNLSDSEIIRGDITILR